MHDQDTKLRSMMDKLEREEHQMLEDSKKELSEVLIKIDVWRNHSVWCYKSFMLCSRNIGN
mgnify:FL=1